MLLRDRIFSLAFLSFLIFSPLSSVIDTDFGGKEKYTYADEVLSDNSVSEIQKLFENPLEYDGFVFPRLSFHLGRWIKHGGWYPDRQLRLFNKKKCSWVN